MRYVFTILAMGLVATGLVAAQPASPAPQTMIRGVVTSVAGSKVTLLKGLTIDVSGAKITKRNVSAPDAVVVGARVRAFINDTKSSGALVADSVIVEAPDATITGTISAVTAASITVGGQVLSLGADTQYGGFAAGTAVRAAEDLKTGMPAIVDVAATNGGFAATRVVAVGPAPAPPPRPQAAQTSITGAVSRVGVNTWTISGTTVYLSPKTTMLGSPGLGTNVVVTGVKTPEGAVIANIIAKQ